MQPITHFQVLVSLDIETGVTHLERLGRGMGTMRKEFLVTGRPGGGASGKRRLL